MQHEYISKKMIQKSPPCIIYINFSVIVEKKKFDITRFLFKLNYTEEKYKVLFTRCLNIISKLDFRDLSALKKCFLLHSLRYFDDYSIEAGFTGHVIRIWAVIFLTPGVQQYLLENERE